MLEFLRKLFSAQSKAGGEYFCITAKRASGNGWRERFITSPEGIRDVLREFPEDQYNLYFCPTPLKRPKRLKPSIAGSQLLWADLDEVNPRSIPEHLKPTWAWETSPNRYAALWLTDEVMKPQEAEELNRWLTYKLGADPSGWDLTQVLRLPETINHKYPKAPRGKMLWYMPTERLRLSELRKLWGKGGDDLEENETGYEEQGGGETYRRVRSRLHPSVRKLVEAKVATKGKRSEVLWLLQNKLAEAGLSPQEVLDIVRQTVWNKFRGRRDEEKALRRDVTKVVGTRLARDDGKKPSGVKVNGEHVEAHPDIKVERMDHVKAEPIEWLWYPYIPIGKITILEGNPNIGKSWLIYTLASHFSLGKALPESKYTSRVRSLICSVEDNVSDTMKNRLNKLGGDHRWIFATNQPFRLDEDGIGKFEALCEEHRPGIVFFDPFFAYMGGNVDMFRANETREVLSRVQDVAVRHRFAAVCVRHLTKGNRDGSALFRGQGSIDITAAARSVLVAGTDPDDENLKVFMQIKNNLGPLGSPINFTTEDGGLQWGERRPDVSASAVMNAESTGGGQKLGWVRDWLRNELADGPKKASEVELNAEKSSISRMTLRRAKEELKVVPSRSKDGWYWELPKK